MLISPKHLIRRLRHALDSVYALYRDGKVLISPKHLVRELRHALGSVQALYRDSKVLAPLQITFDL